MGSSRSSSRDSHLLLHNVLRYNSNNWLWVFLQLMSKNITINESNTKDKSLSVYTVASKWLLKGHNHTYKKSKYSDLWKGFHSLCTGQGRRWPILDWKGVQFVCENLLHVSWSLDINTLNSASLARVSIKIPCVQGCGPETVWIIQNNE